MNRRAFLKTVPAAVLAAAVPNLARAAASMPGATQDASKPSGATSGPGPTTAPQEEIQWTDVRDLTVEGKGWSDTERFFDRLPPKAQGLVTDRVWQLSRQSSGMVARFRTDSPSIFARWTVADGKGDSPTSGVGSLDLYARKAGRWWWAGAGKCERRPQAPLGLIEGMDGRMREFMLYLNLNGNAKSLEIGVVKGSFIEPAKPRRHKPIAWYGTSIVQAGCASRPGMTHVAILGRRLNRPMLNLGFSGTARMEKEIVDLLAELDPSVFVLDALANMNFTDSIFIERMLYAVRTIRASRPDTPIVLVEDATAANAHLLPDRMKMHRNKRRNLRAVYNQLLEEGTTGLHYIPGENLCGHDGEHTIDGIHPSDLGFVRLADSLEPFLQPLV